MNPGGQVVTFLVAGGGVSRDKMGVAVKAVTSTDVGGCFMQPLSVKDVVDDTNFSEASWKCIAPANGPDVAANAAVLACKAEDNLLFGGFTFRVQGAKQYFDWNGAADHVTVVCQRQDG